MNYLLIPVWIVTGVLADWLWKTWSGSQKARAFCLFMGPFALILVVAKIIWDILTGAFYERP